MVRQILLQKQKEIGRVEIGDNVQALTLKSLLNEEQVHGIESGTMIAVCGGTKLELDDTVRGTVVLVSPLVGG